MNSLYTINREQMTRIIQRKIAEIPEFGVTKVLFENPSNKATFPVCVVSNFMARPKYYRAAYSLSITIEVWADKYYEAQALYDLVVQKLAELNFVDATPTPQGKDAVTGKNRYGSSFEVGWNAITNTYYTNRS